MSSSIPARKRDRFRSLFAKSPSGAHAEPQVSAQAAPRNRRSPSVSSSSRSRAQVSHTSHDFLEDALKELTDDERVVIQGHTASSVDDTIQAVYNAAAIQKAVCEDNRWPGSDKANKVLLWLDRFKFVGDIAANADPVHVGLPWAGIRMLLEIAVADSRQMMALVNGMDLALCIANRLRAYFAYFQRLPSALTTDNFRKALVALYAQIFRFLAKAIRMLSLNPALRKVQAAWQDSDLKAFQSQCSELAERADIEASNCDRDEFAQWKFDLQQTLQELDNIENLQLSLDSLHTKVDLSKLVRIPGATFNSIEEDQLPQCLEKTRIELLRQIARWADLPDEKCIFWLCGKAGTGKSTISRTVAQVLHDKKRLGASFFFKRGFSGRSDASCFFPTIVAQLADQIPPMRQFIAKALDEDSFLCSRNLQTQFDRLLSQPLSRLESTQLPPAGLTIVIDALDECQRNMDVRKFLSLLAQVKAISGLRLRIFVTSRPELPIEIGFQKIDGTLHEDVILEEAQAATIESDLRTYFAHQFTVIKSDWAMRRPHDVLPTDWPAQAHIEALVDLAVPLFIFASTVCRYVGEKNPKKRLQSILEQQYTVASLQLQDEHKYLGLTYAQILQDITNGKNEDRTNENINRFRDVVGSIVLLAGPLSSTALSKLLRIDVEELDDVFDGLRSVLIVPKDHDDPIRMLHLSFREFLVDEHNADNQKFRVNEAQTHAKLAQRCLTRLAEPGVLLQDICGLKHPGTRRLEITSQQIQSHIAPDIAYACKYWPWHFINGGEQLSDDGQVHEYLRTHFLHWLEVLSWLGSLTSVIDCISDLLSVAKGDNAKAVSMFLKDAKRFMLKNRYPIDLAPLQVYHSAMIFAPIRSVVRETFDKQVPKLWAQLPSVPMRWSAEILTLEGHDVRIHTVAFSPDGRLVASASSGNTLRLWNARSGEEMHNLGTQDLTPSIDFSENSEVVSLRCSKRQGFAVQSWNVQTGEQMQNPGDPGDSFGSTAFSPDGQLSAISNYSWQVHLFDNTTGKQTHCLEGHIALITVLIFSPDNQVLASGSADGTCQLWDTKSAIRKHHYHEHNKRITSIAFAPDGSTVASASEDGALQLCDAQRGKLTHKLRIPNDLSSTVAFSHDGKIVALAADDQILRLWDVQTGEQILNLERHEWVDAYVMPVMALSPVEHIIAVAIYDQTIQLRSSQTGDQIQTLEQDSRVVALAFSSSGRILASAGGKTVWLWNVQTGEWLRKLEHDSNVHAVSFSSDGQVFISTLDDGTVKLWNALTGEQTQEIKTSAHGHTNVGISPDGLVISSGPALWNAQTGELIFEMRGEDEEITAEVVSQKGQTVALGSYMGTLRLWNLTGNEQVQKLEMCDRPIAAIAVSLDGQVVAAASWDGTVQLRNVKTGNHMWKTDSLRDEDDVNGETTLAFSPDGHVLAISDGLTVQVRDTRTGERIRDMTGRIARISRIAFSPDSQIIAGASSSRDMTIRLWNTQTGEQTQEYSGHTQRISAIAFSPDSQQLASASSDGTVRLWSIQHSDTIQKLRGYGDRILAVALSPDGRIAASASRNGTVKLWNTCTAEQMRRLEMHIEGLTSEECQLLAFSPGGKYVAAASYKTVWLWNTQTGEQTQVLNTNRDASRVMNIWVLAFSPDGRKIAAASSQTIRLWDTQTGKQTQALKPTIKGVKHWDTNRLILSFSPDGKIIAAVSGKPMSVRYPHETVWLWNTHTGEQTQVLKLDLGEQDFFHCLVLVFSPDGRTIAAASDEAIWLWDTQTGVQTQMLKPTIKGLKHLDAYNDDLALGFSPDGKIIAAVLGTAVLLRDTLETLWLWNTQTGKQIQDLDELRLERAFSLDGGFITSKSDNKTLRLCSLATDKQTKLVLDVDNSYFRIGYPWNVSNQTIKGISVLTDALPHGVEIVTAQRAALERSDQWIGHQGRELLWLPHEYRGGCFAVQGEILVIGQASGAVSFFRLS